MSEYTTRQFLDMIEANGGPWRLDLAGKNLSGIDLGRETIRAELERVQQINPHESPAWYSNKTDGIYLATVNLQEADLSFVNLQGAYLKNTNFQEAKLGRADLRDTYLGGANLQGALLIWAKLQGASLRYADLQGANLMGSKLQRADLGTADLRNAYLRGVDLRGTYVGSANLQGVHLEHSHLEKVDFFDAKSFKGVFLYGAFLGDTRIRVQQLGAAIGEEEEEQFDQAKEAYMALKNNFDERGDYDAASWAYRKERRMEKLEALQRARTALTERKWWAAVANYAKFAGDQLVECMCDYGESTPRVLGSLLLVYVLFTLIYGLTWSVMRVYETPAALIKEPTRNLIDLARFSLGAMTTMEPAGLEPRNGLVELVAGLEALLGIALTGLLGFVLGNRIRRS